MEPLKEMFNLSFYEKFTTAFVSVDRDFNKDGFLRDVTQNMEALSLNGRLRNTSLVLKSYLPATYKKALTTLYAVAPSLPRGYTSLVLPDFVALYGQDDFELSMEALRDFTSMGSSEFAVRTFIKADLKKALQIMNSWAEDKNVHVRRLASEGSRPRLPWSFKLDAIIENPSLTQGILEKLNKDPELYVRKSVANHLNDHSKDNVDYLIDVLSGWDVSNPHTAWIMKHASRSLIKKGNPAALQLFGFGGDVEVELTDLRLENDRLKLGDTLTFSFTLTSKEAQLRKMVVDYAIHYVKSAGGLSRKVFKLKEVQLMPGQHISISKRQTIQDFTTRKHYPGKHLLEIMVNGKVMATESFVL
ncbi:MAG: DNA alkylation repair protein [Pedobacter sp.]|nr:MAG: DNA alkylation repair protein [Pedobacter sp.]